MDLYALAHNFDTDPPVSRYADTNIGSYLVDSAQQHGNRNTAIAEPMYDHTPNSPPIP